MGSGVCRASSESACWGMGLGDFFYLALQCSCHGGLVCLYTPDEVSASTNCWPLHVLGTSTTVASNVRIYITLQQKDFWILWTCLAHHCAAPGSNGVMFFFPSRAGGQESTTLLVCSVPHRDLRTASSLQPVTAAHRDDKDPTPMLVMEAGRG